MELHGYPQKITSDAEDADGDRLHHAAYLQLRNDLRTHILSRQEPELLESVKPTDARQWQPSQRVRQVFGDAEVEFAGAEQQLLQ